MRNPLRRPSTSQARASGWLAAVLELLEVRLALLALDVRSDASRLLALAALTVAGALLLVFALAFAGVFITVALWEQHAIAALGGITLLFATAGGVLLWLAKRYAARLSNAFAATRAELRADSQRLRGIAPDAAPTVEDAQP